MGALSYDSGFKVLARIPDAGLNIQLEWLMKLGLDDGSLLMKWRCQTEKGIQGSGRWDYKYELIIWDWRTRSLCFPEGHREESSLYQEDKQWTANRGSGIFRRTIVHLSGTTSQPLGPTSYSHHCCSISSTWAMTSFALVRSDSAWPSPSMGLWFPGLGPLWQCGQCRILGIHTHAAWHCEGTNLCGATLGQWGTEADEEMLPPLVVQSRQLCMHLTRLLREAWCHHRSLVAPSMGQPINTFWCWLLLSTPRCLKNHFPNKAPAQKLSEELWIKQSPVVRDNGGERALIWDKPLDS